MRVEIAKPLDRSWDELGTQLRALTNVAHRCMQGAMLHLTRYDCDQLKNPENPKSGKAYTMETLAYHGAKDALSQYNAWARKNDKPEVHVPGGTMAAWAKEAYTRWDQWVKDKKRDRLPSWGHGAAILLRKQELTVYADEQGKPVAKVLIGKKRERIAIRIGHGGKWSVIERMLSGEIEQLSGSIVYNKRARRKDGSRGKWFLMIVYKAPVATAPEVGPWLAVHRGTHNLFTLLSSGGQPWKRIPGSGLAHQKKCMKARMRDVQQSMSAGEIGTGARGHGSKRRYAAYSKLEDKLERMMQTRIRQMAARVVKLAKQWHCQGILIEDYGSVSVESMSPEQRRSITLLPAAFAKEAIISAATAEGFVVHETPALYISTKCPACGAIHAASHNKRTGIFHCKDPSCSFERDVDWVAGYWMLLSGVPSGQENKIEKNLKKEREIAIQLKSGQAA